MPTQKDENEFSRLLPVTVETVHEPETEVTVPVEPVTAYPLQLVLNQVESAFILGPNDSWGVVANAGLIAAKSISEPMRNANSLIEVFIRIHPFLL
jgi:hypothetical protein